MKLSRRFAILWSAIALGVFGGGFALATSFDLNSENRAAMTVMLGTLMILNAVWQAAGILLSGFERMMLPKPGEAVA